MGFAHLICEVSSAGRAYRLRVIQGVVFHFMSKLINSGHYLVDCPGHPNLMSNGKIYEHIVVAEQKIGRYLRKGEVVHHLDENGFNNSLDNLIVFATNAEHTAFHFSKDKTKLYFDEEGIAHFPLTERSEKGYRVHKCKICGGLCDIKAEMCKSCYNATRRKSFDRISRQELKDLIRKEPFVKIGKMFGVSDNAIRKWCIKHGLPKTKREINSLSDEEWKTI